MGNWSKLKADEKVRVIKFAGLNGVSDINTIRDTYNLYSSGGLEEILNKVNSSNANFVQRLKDPNRKNIPDWESPDNRISTHKLSVGTDENGNHYIFPEVQEINGELIDFTRPPYHRFAGEISAEMRGDTVRVPSINEGVKFTETYKLYYPFNNGSNLIYKKSTGGPLYPFSFEKNPFLKTPVVRYEEGGLTYTVKSGDYLGKIASMYGLKVADIVSANPGLEPDKINVGQTLVIPNVQASTTNKGLSKNAIIPSREAIIKTAWLNENPNNMGYNNGLYYPYEDPNGRGMNVGPGLLVGSAISKKDSYTKKELDNAAYNYGLESLNAIGKAFNEKYGTAEFATPFDTVSVGPKLLALDTRYLNGSLPVEKWPNFYLAIADGNWAKAIQQSRSTYTDKNDVIHYDNDRVRRRAESIFPNMFSVSYKHDSRELPVVTKKK